VDFAELSADLARVTKRMLKRLAGLVFVFLAALSVAGCIWAISANREVLAVVLGSLGLLTFVAAWLIALPSALGQP
jgi:hypothetical protein